MSDLLYLVGVVGFAVFAGILVFRTNRLENKVTALAQTVAAFEDRLAENGLWL